MNGLEILYFPPDHFSESVSRFNCGISTGFPPMTSNSTESQLLVCLSLFLSMTPSFFQSPRSEILASSLTFFFSLLVDHQFLWLLPETCVSQVRFFFSNSILYHGDPDQPHCKVVTICCFLVCPSNPSCIYCGLLEITIKKKKTHKSYFIPWSLNFPQFLCVHR